MTTNETSMTDYTEDGAKKEAGDEVADGHSCIDS